MESIALETVFDILEYFENENTGDFSLFVMKDGEVLELSDGQAQDVRRCGKHCRSRARRA